MFKSVRKMCHYRNSYCISAYFTKQLYSCLRCENKQIYFRSDCFRTSSFQNSTTEDEAAKSDKIDKLQNKKSRGRPKKEVPTGVANNKINKSEKKKLSKAKLKPVNGISTNIANYFSSKEHAAKNLEMLSKMIKLVKKYPDALYIIDPDLAKTIASHIRKDMCTSSAVLEINPGIGVLTEELLSAGITNIRLIESHSEFSEKLHELEQRYINRLNVKFEDFFALWKLLFQDRPDASTRLDEVLEGVKKKDWDDEPALTVIGVLPCLTFLRNLISNFVVQNGIVLYGRPELYLIMPEPIFTHLTCDGTAGYTNYRVNSVLFQLLFHATLLEKFPRKSFLPWHRYVSSKKKADVPKKKARKLQIVEGFVEDPMCLVKIEARRDIIENVVPVDQLQPLSYFVKHHMISRTKRIIPELERWIPGCGPRLLIKGISIYDEFGQLTPQEFLKLYREFRSWPEYPTCSFNVSSETVLLKSAHTEQDANIWTLMKNSANSTHLDADADSDTDSSSEDLDDEQSLA